MSEHAESDYPDVGLFITGTDTEVGKTYVTSLIASQLASSGKRIGVYKPVASGCTANVPTDAQRIWEAAGAPESLELVCPQQFGAPLAPHLAARAEGKQVDERLLTAGLEKWSGLCDMALVEAVGGLMSPVSDDLYCADLAESFGYPLLVVVPNRLGCINQALQTLIAAATFRDGLAIAGVVLNDVVPSEGDASATSNLDELLQRCQPPIVAHIAHGQTHSPPVDWMGLARAGKC